MQPRARPRASFHAALLALLCLVAPLAAAWVCAAVARGVPSVDRAFAGEYAADVELHGRDRLGPRPWTSRWARNFWSTHDVYFSEPATTPATSETAKPATEGRVAAALLSRYGLPFRCATLERAGVIEAPVVDVPREWSLAEGTAGGWSPSASSGVLVLPLRIEPLGYVMNVVCYLAASVGVWLLARVWRERSTPPVVCASCGARMYGISVCASCGARHQVL